MILISYDISDNKLRTKFSHYIRRYGERVQFSVYEIENSSRILDNILADINNDFLSKFDERDSVLIFKLSPTCEVIRVGYAAHEDECMIMV